MKKNGDNTNHDELIINIKDRDYPLLDDNSIICEYTNRRSFRCLVL